MYYDTSNTAGQVLLSFSNKIKQKYRTHVSNLLWAAAMLHTDDGCSLKKECFFWWTKLSALFTLNNLRILCFPFDFLSLFFSTLWRINAFPLTIHHYPSYWNHIIIVNWYFCLFVLSLSMKHYHDWTRYTNGICFSKTSPADLNALMSGSKVGFSYVEKLLHSNENLN